MSENNLLAVHVLCRDCGQPMAVIQQENLDGNYLIQVTCWQPNCLLRGFTLSLDRYVNLKESQLEAYREMHHVYWSADAGFKIAEEPDVSELFIEAFHFFESIEAINPSVAKNSVRLNYSKRNIDIAEKLKEASRIMKLICSLDRDIIQCNRAINNLRKELIASPIIASLEIQNCTLLQTVFNLKQQYQSLVEEIEEMRQEKMKYLDKHIA